MAKALKVVGKIASAAAVVLAFIPGGQPFAAAASAIAGVANAASSLLAQPQPQGGSVNNVLIDASAPTPYIIGRTMTGGALVHDAGYGADYKKIPNPNRSMVFVYSDCGPVQSVEALYTDGSYATAAGNVNGYYSGHMHFAKQVGSRPQFSALSGNQGSIPRWGSSYKLSGKAAGIVTMRWDKKQVKFSGGTPRFSAIVQGVKVYDPRLDSTYPGGSGSCRVDNEATFVYSENPSLHALTYIYGRYEGTKKIFGVGKAIESIDVPAFVEWANVCDTNNWKVGGIIYEPADRWNNLKLIMQAGSARPVHNNGVLSVVFNSPKVPVATFTEDDLANGDISIPSTQSFRDRINGIVPRYRSSGHNWEYIPGTAVTVPQYVAADGEDKRKEIQYTLCQANQQAAQLAGYEIVNSRELTGITIPFKPKILPYGPGEAISLNMPNLGLVGTYVIESRRFDPLTAITQTTVRTETASKHPFALGATTTPPEAPTLTLGEDLDATNFGTSGSAAALEALIASSWTKDLVITATNAGEITLSNHSRVYADETVSVIGDVISGLTLDTRYSVYYDDSERDGGAVTYAATTTHVDAQTSEETPSRHFVGYVTIPETSASEPNTGETSVPPNVVPETVPNAGALGGAPAEEIRAEIQANQQGVANLVSTYGTTASAVQSAAAALAAQSASAQSETNAISAQNLAQTAQGQAQSILESTTTARDAATAAQIIAESARDAAVNSANSASASSSLSALSSSKEGLVLNSGFELGEEGWSFPGSSLHSILPAHSGRNNVLCLPQGRYDIRVIEDLPIESGRKYKLRGSVRTDSTIITRPFFGWQYKDANGAPVGSNGGHFYPGFTTGISSTDGWVDFQSRAIFEGNPGPHSGDNIPAGAVRANLFIFSDVTNSANGNTYVDKYVVEDVTNGEAAIESATAAATSETNASASATSASQQAVVAQTERVAAETARSGAEAAQVQAVSSQTSAAGSASQAASSASLAANSESAAGNSATAAGNSATAAGTSATEAAQSASLSQTNSLAAQTARAQSESARDAAVVARQDAESAQAAASQSSGIAVSTSADLFPSDFSQDGTYFGTHAYAGLSLDQHITNLGPTFVDLPEGRVARFNNTTSGAGLVTRGHVVADNTRRYRVRLVARVTQGHTNGSARFTIGNIVFNGAGQNISNQQHWKYFDSEVETPDFQVLEHYFGFGEGASPFQTVAGGQPVAYSRFQCAIGHLTNWQNGDGIIDVLRFEVTDVTESFNAEGSASASATSAQTASAQQDLAAQSATASAQSATLAQTAQAAAAVSRDEAATSETNAEGSSSSAAQSATTASNAAQSAGNSATSAGTSATTASSSATQAQNSANSATTAQVAAEASKDSAQNSASAAASSASSASASATASGQSAQSAQNSENQAATAASSATISAGNAATSETNAGNSASSAALSVGLSATAAARLFPSDFSGDGQFFQSVYHASSIDSWVPLSAAGLSFPTVAGEGVVLELNAAVALYGFTTRGYLPYIAGRKYRVTIRHKIVQAHTNGPVQVTLGSVNYNSAGTRINWSQTKRELSVTDTGWVEYSLDMSPPSASAGQPVAYWRPQSSIGYTNSFGNGDGIVQASRFIIEDITESAAAAQSAEASALSSTAASASATSAAQFSQASETARIAAETAQGSAEVARDSAVASSNSAAGSSTAAQNSATTAANSASAASGSAGSALVSQNSAATSASSAAGSASAAALSAQVSARVTRQGIMSDPAFLEPFVSGIPANWTNWSGSVSEKSRDTLIKKNEASLKIVAPAAGSGVFSYNTSVFIPQSKPSRYMVVEGWVYLASGTFQGSGVHVRPYHTYNGAASGLQGNINFGTEFNNNDRYAWRRFSVFMDLSSDPSITHLRIHLMANWTGFGTQTAKTIHFGECEARDATPEEIEAQKVSTIEADVFVASSAVTSLEGYAAATHSVQVNANGAVAGVSVRAAGSGNVTTTDIKLSADALIYEADGEVVWYSDAGGLTMNKAIRWVAGGTSTNPDTMYVLGLGFGANSDLMEWFGPYSSTVGNLTKSNGIRAKTTDGKTYLAGTEEGGGAISASQTGTSVAQLTGIGTNNNTVEISSTYSIHATQNYQSSTPPSNGTVSAGTATIRMGYGSGSSNWTYRPNATSSGTITTTSFYDPEFNAYIVKKVFNLGISDIHSIPGVNNGKYRTDRISVSVPSGFSVTNQTTSISVFEPN